MLSLNLRLFLATTLVLAAFLSLTGWTLESAFRTSVETSQHERLQSQLYGLLAAVQIAPDGSIQVNEEGLDPRLRSGDSGFYAQVTAHDRAGGWSTESARHVMIPYVRRLNAGTTRFEYLNVSNRGKVYALSIGLTWKVKNKQQGYTYSVAQSADNVRNETAQFRKTVWTWLGGVALVLLIAQGIIVRWGLSPLRRVAEELSEIEAGRAVRLEGPYPKELQPLTTNLNGLITNGQARLDRYRHALADLAHSLKTPLAVIRGAVAESTTRTALEHVVEEHVERMSQIVDYQLQRAGTEGRTTLSAAVHVDEVITRVVASLNKVYADKAVHCEINIAPQAVFHGDSGDLLEVIGNLADNAYKWCRAHVSLRAALADDPGGLVIDIEDDGCGIDPAHVEHVLQRGGRADEAIHGHGIGLAVVQDIVRAYGGSLQIDASTRWSGAHIRVFLPS